MSDNSTSPSNLARFQAIKNKEEAEEVKSTYESLNKETVEVVAERIPHLRAVFFKKVKIDENANKFPLKKGSNSNQTTVKRCDKDTPLQRKEKALKLREEGKNTNQIARILGVHVSTIQRDLR